VFKKPTDLLDYLDLEVKLVTCWGLGLVLFMVFIGLPKILSASLKLRKVFVASIVQLFSSIGKVEALFDAGIFRKHIYSCLVIILFALFSCYKVNFKFFRNLNLLMTDLNVKTKN